MTGLLDLPDEILVHILLYVSHCKILQLGDVHNRLQNLLNNTAVWTHVSFSRPVPASVLRKCVKYLGRHTKSLRITGYSGGKRPKPESNITDSFFSTLKQKCVGLSSLSFHDVWFNQPVRVDSFLRLIPDSVTSLELKNCHLPHTPTREKNFLHLLNRTNIQKLALIKCKWLVCKDMIEAISNPKMQTVRFEECRSFSNISHSVVIKTPRQMSAQKRDNQEPLDLTICGCELKQELMKCLFTLNGARIHKLTLNSNKNIKIKQLMTPYSNFKKLEYLDVRKSDVENDVNFMQEVRSNIPRCEINT
eukprot:TRINITY_DN1365_c0_g1_i5.p1 TRINITY_DN1365_c0_g1~~TRINITY_DN1365_c0_g1_i5.p1  ORF type:complete len:305 (-),score=28.46 TRINITY_DN1365_c0_g1_i5:324-1238(-)